MTLMNDSLYDALQCFEMKLSMQRNRCVQMPCRQIVQTSMQVASLMLRDEDVERNKAAYFCLINRQMNGSVQERMMVLIVTAALLGLLDSPHARRCRNTLRDDVCEEFDEYLSLYEHFLASGDTRFTEEDFLIDTHTQIQQLTAQNEQLTYENQQLKNDLRKMEKEKKTYIGYNVEHMTINMSGGTLVQHADLVQASGEVKVQTAEQTETPKEENMHSSLFTKKALSEGKTPEIIRSLQQSLSGRQDKARALVEEIRHWQREGYMDAHFNARVMYDELDKILNLPFQYGGFRKYYNE